jgi:GT2 family glycosyltransferase
VVTFRSADVLAPCLASLEGVPTVVVDNASDDGTRAIASSFPHVQLVEHERNRGFAAGVNTGLEHSRGDVLLLNPDARLREGALPALLETQQRHPRAGVVAPRLFNADGSVQSSARTFKTLAIFAARRTALGRTAAGARALGAHLVDCASATQTTPVDWVLGAAMLIRAEAVASVGPMDDGFFLYEEDQDWCARMWAAGWSVLYEPAAEVDHLYQRASRDTWRVWQRPTRAHWHSVARLTRKYPRQVLLGRPLPGRHHADDAHMSSPTSADI